MAIDTPRSACTPAKRLWMPSVARKTAGSRGDGAASGIGSRCMVCRQGRGGGGAATRRPQATGSEQVVLVGRLVGDHHRIAADQHAAAHALGERDLLVALHAEVHPVGEGLL